MFLMCTIMGILKEIFNLRKFNVYTKRGIVEACIELGRNVK